MIKETKLIKVKPEVHKKLLDLANRRDVAVGDIIEYLLDNFEKGFSGGAVLTALEEIVSKIEELSRSDTDLSEKCRRWKKILNSLPKEKRKVADYLWSVERALLRLYGDVYKLEEDLEDLKKRNVEHIGG